MATVDEGRGTPKLDPVMVTCTRPRGDTTGGVTDARVGASYAQYTTDVAATLPMAFTMEMREPCGAQQ